MEEIVDSHMFHQEKVKLCDRTVALITKNPVTTRLDFFDGQEAQDMQWEEQQKRYTAAQAARQMGQGIAEAEAAQCRRHQDNVANWSGGDANWDAEEDCDAGE